MISEYLTSQVSAQDLLSLLNDKLCAAMSCPLYFVQVARLPILKLPRPVGLPMRKMMHAKR